MARKQPKKCSPKALAKEIAWPVDADGHKWYPVMFKEPPLIQTCDYCHCKREWGPNYIDEETFELKRKLKYGPQPGRCRGALIDVRIMKK